MRAARRQLAAAAAPAVEQSLAVEAVDEEKRNVRPLFLNLLNESLFFSSTCFLK